MAAALVEGFFPKAFYLASAGILPGDRDPFVDIVLKEVALDLGPHRPRGLDDLHDLNFDLVVTLSPEAHHYAMELTRTEALEVEYWPTMDPAANLTETFSTREQILDGYRDLRDLLAHRIRDRFAPEGPRHSRLLKVHRKPQMG
ncbi:Protein-tyrosine-phosphatase [Faunimonas pinastri]|uniref:Protein-tyrosine-phosphatase n=2 Tax=Faunimonas pinastri TaxID=1855383 RepID=A0A1H9ISJ0_9HYPH|nr:Protein-tyrosine-phosphatase [Faunimonas pinastri]